MQDAMTIWDSICHSQWFKSTSIVSGISYAHPLAAHADYGQILFLNKDDIFREKIKASHIRNTFPVSIYMSTVRVEALIF